MATEPTTSPPKSETFKDFETNEISDASLVELFLFTSYQLTFQLQNIRKWMNLGYRLYGNMLDNSEYSFFISTPQLISQLAFLMSVCQEKTTGLRSEFGWIPTTGELAHQVQHKNLMENTETFMKKWRKELMEASSPGQIKSARRALCYSASAVSVHFNTLECLRRYLVELKLFEGAQEHRNWITQSLEGNYEKHTVVNVWDEEVVNNDSKNAEKDAKETHILDHNKKVPILIWISRASIAILPEIFDAKFVYTLKSTEYFRVTSTPKKSISVRESLMPWNMIILPCVNETICFVIIYGFSRNLCPYEDLRIHINEHRSIAPCVVRKCQEKQCSSYGDDLQKLKSRNSIKNIYFPHWDDTDFNPNRLSEGLQRTTDIEETFTKGGFGDLATANATPLSGDMFKIGHLQNFSTLRFFNAPSTRIPTEDMSRNKNSKKKIENNNLDDEIVPFPFSAILWDSNRHVPIFMGKLTGKDARNSNDPGKKKYWNMISDLFQRKK